mmetsp:Transcript_1692/g.3496  ORF Transcript_1692/g.3496 Transcript_1692/m.3496 type:complete len:82 (+) Transcript_1692:511-756(+)
MQLTAWIPTQEGTIVTLFLFAIRRTRSLKPLHADCPKQSHTTSCHSSPSSSSPVSAPSSVSCNSEEEPGPFAFPSCATAVA